MLAKVSGDAKFLRKLRRVRIVRVERVLGRERKGSQGANGLCVIQGIDQATDAESSYRCQGEAADIAVRYRAVSLQLSFHGPTIWQERLLQISKALSQRDIWRPAQPVVFKQD